MAGAREIRGVANMVAGQALSNPEARNFLADILKNRPNGTKIIDLLASKPATGDAERKPANFAGQMAYMTNTCLRNLGLTISHLEKAAVEINSREAKREGIKIAGGLSKKVVYQDAIVGLKVKLRYGGKEVIGESKGRVKLSQKDSKAVK